VVRVAAASDVVGARLRAGTIAAMDAMLALDDRGFSCSPSHNPVENGAEHAWGAILGAKTGKWFSGRTICRKILQRVPQAEMPCFSGISTQKQSLASKT
jgi:hypothetical protein